MRRNGGPTLLAGTIGPAAARGLGGRRALALAPAAILFQPDADAAYPLVSTLALALAAWSAQWSQGNRGISSALALAFASGLVMALGTFYTLAFLPVGLIVALVIALAPEVVFRRKAGLILAVGAGFLIVTMLGWIITGADPITVWTWNLKNHARFYVEYPRTYRAWLVLNPIELAIALGLPTTVWCIVGVSKPSYRAPNRLGHDRGDLLFEPARPQHGRGRPPLDALSSPPLAGRRRRIRQPRGRAARPCHIGRLGGIADRGTPSDDPGGLSGLEFFHVPNCPGCPRPRWDLYKGTYAYHNRITRNAWVARSNVTPCTP